MRIYNFSAKAGSGKDLACEIIKEYYGKDKVCHMLFAKYIKGYAKDYFGWDGEEATKPRELLQKIGTEIIRDKMENPNFHANRLIEDIKILSNYFDVFVVTDCRFENELKLLNLVFKKDVINIRIERPDYDNKMTEEQKNHKSETSLDGYDEWDFIIKNNGTLKEFYKKIKEVLNDR